MGSVYRVPLEYCLVYTSAYSKGPRTRIVRRFVGPQYHDFFLVWALKSL